MSNEKEVEEEEILKRPIGFRQLGSSESSPFCEGAQQTEKSP